MYSLTLAADDSAGLYAEARSAMARELGESAPDPKLNQARVRFAAALEEMFTMVPRQGGAPLEFSLRLGGG
jgi:hypothetical protein